MYIHIYTYILHTTHMVSNGFFLSERDSTCAYIYIYIYTYICMYTHTYVMLIYTHTNTYFHMESSDIKHISNYKTAT